VENFTETIPKFFEWYGYPMLIWTPVVEPEVRRGKILARTTR